MNFLSRHFCLGALVLSCSVMQAVQLVSNPAGFRAVAGGDRFTAFLNSNGTLYFCGSNSVGQQGDATNLGSEAPVFATPRRMARGVTQVAVGSKHSLFIKEDGTLWGSGSSSSGALGTGFPDDEHRQVQIDSDVTAIAAADETSFFIKKDKSLWGMGWAGDGQLGAPTTQGDRVYRAVKLAENVVSVYTNGDSSYILKTDGAWYASGWNFHGQLGLGNNADYKVWTKVSGAYTSVTACYNSSAWLGADGKLYVLGNNDYGTLGNGYLPDPLNPNLVERGPSSFTPVLLKDKIKQALGNYETLLYLDDAGIAWVTGIGMNNDVGFGADQIYIPKKLPGATEVVALYNGWQRTYFQKKDGTLWACGNNQYGTLGDGSTDNPLTYVQVGLTVAPVMFKDPTEVSAGPHKMAEFKVYADALAPLSYEWQRKAAGTSTWAVLSDSAIFAGTQTAILQVKDVQEGQEGDSFRCKVSTAGGSVTSDSAILHTGWNRILNMSVRTTAGSGEDKLSVGMALGGTGSKQILVRSIGPGLAQWLTGTMADPGLKVFNKDGIQIQQNDNWGGSGALTTAMSELQAFPLAADSKDAAIYASFVGTNTTYTMETEPSSGTGGILLLELYDADKGHAPSSNLINISALNKVGVGAEHLVAGFVIDGNVPMTLLVRGVGETLATKGWLTGELKDPKLQVWKSEEGKDAILVKENDNWGGSAELRAAFNKTYAFDLADTSKDAAILVTLNPGIYTAEVSGVGDTTGKAIIEVYVVP